MPALDLSDDPARPLILDYDLEELQQVLSEWGEPGYRAQQIWEGLYRQYWQKADLFQNLPLALRKKLGDYFVFQRLEPVSELKSSDRRTIKTLFRLPQARGIEAVVMRYEKRRTLCISTQAGCGMGCVFCATGQMGLQKNLSSGEIIQQVLYYARQLQDTGEKVSNIVVMGMGEPFHNYQATLSAIQRLNHPQGFNLGSRRVTISTVGLVPQIQRFTNENHQINLAVSLHAADDELRSSLLPINKRYPLKILFEACLDYVTRSRRRISFEWALIQGRNDRLEQAERLSRWLIPFRIGNAMLCHVNLIPLNPIRKYSGQASTQKQAQEFKHYLESQGIPCTIRLRRGIDIQAGCGQLAVEET